MNCETCGFWLFPTKSLHQHLLTHGQCTYEFPSETLPGYSCDYHKHVERDTEFGMAVGAAIRLKRRQEFGDIMNNRENEAQIRDLQNQIAKLSESPQPYQAKPGDPIHVRFKEPFKYVMARNTGTARMAVLEAPDGSLHIFDNAICEFRVTNDTK